MKKKLLIILLCGLSVSSLFSCGKKGSKEKDSKEVSADIEKEQTTIVTGFTFDIPETFVSDESREGFWLANDESGSNIQYSTHPYADSVMDFSSDGLKQEMEALFLEQGYEITVTIDSNESISIDGYEGYKITSSFEHGTTQYKQVQVILITPSLIGDIIYTDINESGCMDSFEQSIASIHVTEALSE